MLREAIGRPAVHDKLAEAASQNLDHLLSPWDRAGHGDHMGVARRGRQGNRFRPHTPDALPTREDQIFPLTTDCMDVSVY